MSLRATLWALDDAPVSDPTAALVLVALADNARDDGTQAWPAVATLAARARVTERSVQRHLRQLEAAGLIARMAFRPPESRTDRAPIVYRLCMERTRTDGVTPTSPRTADGVTPVTPRGDTGDADGVTPTSPEPKDEPTTEPKDSSSANADVVLTLCNLLADLIEQNGSKRPTVSQRWLTACRLMIEADKREPVKIDRAIRWCQSDEFWRANVMSMPKLREKYDQLRLAAQRTKSQHQPFTAPADPARYHEAL